MIRSFIDKHALCAFFSLITIVMSLCLMAPRVAALAAPVAGLLILIVWWIGKGTPLKPYPCEWAFVLAIPGLAALSALWAIDPPFAVERAYKMAPMLIAGLFFIVAARQVTATDITARFVKTITLLYIFISAVIGIEMLTGMTLYNLAHGLSADTHTPVVLMNRAVVVMAAFLPPLLLLLARAPMSVGGKRMIGGAMMAVLLLSLVQTESQNAQLFTILALIVSALFPVRSRLAWILTGAGVVVTMIAAPWIAQYLYALIPPMAHEQLNPLYKAASIPHRIEIWNFIATEIFKSPIYGHGIEAVRYLKSETWLVMANADNMLHPHNAVLQLWVEFGVIGIALGGAFFSYIMYRLWKLPSLLDRRVGLGVLFAMLGVMSTGYGLWQSWQIGLILALFALMTLAYRSGTGLKP